MPARTLRRKHGRSKDLSADRTVATVVTLAVTLVLLLAGFSGSSVDFTLPGPAGWLYIGVVIVVATVFLVWVFRRKPI